MISGLHPVRLALVLALNAAALGAQQIPPLFCLGENARAIDRDDCVVVEKDQPILVDPADEDRLFAFFAERRSVVVVGTLEKGGTSIDPELRPARIELRVDVPSRGWRDALIFRVAEKGKETKKELHINPDDAERLRAIALGEGTFDLAFETPGYFPETRTSVRVSREPARLGRIAFAPLPRIMATVVDRRGDAMPGVNLVDERSAKVLTSSDPLGRIEWEASGSLPDAVALEIPGGARKSFAVPNLRADADLGTVRLAFDSALRLVVERPPGPRTPLGVRLVRDFRTVTANNQVGIEVFRGTIPAEEDEIRIEVEPRELAVYVEGEDPFERISRVVEIAPAEEKAETIRIKPVELEGEILLGSDPFPHVTVRIGPPTAPGPQWEASLKTDREGRFQRTLWQRGPIWAYVSDGTGRSASEGFEILSDEHRHFVRLVVPATRIVLRVIDDESGAPVKVSVRHDAETTRSSRSAGAETDESGEFRVESAVAGRHIFQVRDPRWSPAREEIVTTEEERERVVEMRLKKGSEATVVIVDERGTLLPNGRILEMTASGHDIYSQSTVLTWTSDSAGRATIPMFGSARHVFVVSPSGSFARGMIETRPADEIQRMVVRTVPGTLTIETVDGDGAPVANAFVGMSWDGRWIPQPVLEQIALLQGTLPQTGSDGRVVFRNFPPGEYRIRSVSGAGDPVTALYYGGDQNVRVQANEARP